MSPADEPTRYQNSRMRKFNPEFGYETRDQSFEKRKRCNWLGRGDQARDNADKVYNFYKYRKKKEPYNHLGRGDQQIAAQKMTYCSTQLASPSRHGGRQHIKTDQAKKTGNRC